jgi:hypothetical protein
LDLFDVVRSCIRRWYVVLPLLLVAAWFSHDIYTSTKPVYYSNAVVGMAPPSTRLDQSVAGEPVRRNGLLDVGGAPLIANMTAMGLRDPSVVTQVVAAGGQPDYTSKMFPVPATSPQLPLIMIEATQPDPISASKTVALVVEQTGSALQTLQQQASVPPDQMVTPLVVSPPSPPAEVMPSRIRSTLAIAIAGAGLSILAGVVVDVLLMRWKKRRRARRKERLMAAEPAEKADSAAADKVATESR